ncbi:MAG TPA: response regulator transcription factor [Holophagaceae bacterium]|nr:response regulator transcription factor [Holophagaceae bacterium]
MARILVVDDDPGFRKLMEVLLLKDGYEVMLAESGAVGLDLHEAKPADLIVLDLVMPGVHGFEVLRTLRSLGDEVPIIVYSGQEGDLDRLQAFLLGCDDYAVKPFSPQELRLRIKALLRRTHARQSEVLLSGPYRFDLRRHWVDREGAGLDLTGRELRLLDALLAARGAPCDKSALVTVLGPAKAKPTRRTVDALLKKLGAKLAEGGQASPVEPVLGTGYRWALPIHVE